MPCGAARPALGSEPLRSASMMRTKSAHALRASLRRRTRARARWTGRRRRRACARAASRRGGSGRTSRSARRRSLRCRRNGRRPGTRRRACRLMSMSRSWTGGAKVHSLLRGRGGRRGRRWSCRHDSSGRETGGSLCVVGARRCHCVRRRTTRRNALGRPSPRQRRRRALPESCPQAHAIVLPRWSRYSWTLLQPRRALPESCPPAHATELPRWSRCSWTHLQPLWRRRPWRCRASSRFLGAGAALPQAGAVPVWRACHATSARLAPSAIGLPRCPSRTFPARVSRERGRWRRHR
mmetsp:Transcript_63752/g.152040  ORF Transcript_63752/g.152040 Transcript_63752/m.152040 type:complete len:295 (+) Transcript_63752:276-1160(+)